MKHNTSLELYSYWNSVRAGRIAPERIEIEPVKFAGILPLTYIIECGPISDYRFRLAGTHICHQFGIELRGESLFKFWSEQDREGLESLLHNVIHDYAVGTIQFEAISQDGRRVEYEMTFMPLIHNGREINRIMGSITVSSTPYWLGTTPLTQFKLLDVNLIWPDKKPSFLNDETLEHIDPTPVFNQPSMTVRSDNRVFRVFEGGLANAANEKS